MHRVFDEHIPREPGASCRIEGDEAHHAVRVKRVREGETIGLLDGMGTVAEAVIERVEASKRSSALVVRVVSVETRPPTAPAVHVLAAAPKGSALEQMIDHLSQVGAASWAPLRTEYSEREPRSVDRLRRTAVEAAKQCGRAHLLEIRTGVDLEAALAISTPIVVADAAGEDFSAEAQDPVTILIGPEGGWSDSEREQIEASPARLVRFGPHVMRIETAAVVAAAAMLM